jgi:hypothetical protein
MRRCLGIALVSSLVLAAPARAGGPASAYYAADHDGIFWFMHISDLHTPYPGHSWDPTLSGNEVAHLQAALGPLRTVIAPVFTVATGDLVNGDMDTILFVDYSPTSGQGQEEWDVYKGIYTGAGVTATDYYDIVGNHDEYALRLPDKCPSLHWYLDNSFQGQLQGAAHFSWTHTTPLGDYFFYGLNATGECVDALSGGNGTMLDSEYEAIKAALEANAGSELMFVFAHQGPAQPTSSARVVDELVNHGVFYIHGHVHEYKEYLTSNSTGEIVTNEINSCGKADADNLGLGVVDHNAFIYRATSISDPWPFVIVTAPVAMRLRDGDLNPWAYDVCKDRVNPIRALVFAADTPGPVTVQIGSGPLVNMTQVNGPLWTASVDTSSLAEGQQTVSVTATAGGKTRTDSVTANFVAGPCTILQDDAGVPQDDAGAGADGGGTSDDGGTGDDGGSGDGGPPPPPPAKGCDCHAAGAGAGATWLGLLGGLGVALLARGRGRRRGR